MPSSRDRKSKAISEAGALTSRKKRLFGIFVGLVPLAFFLTLELGLCFFHYGAGYDLVITTSRHGKQYYTINPTVGKRYFNSRRYFVPQIASGSFEVAKSPNTVRVFILGESTSAGFPYEYNTTPSYILQKRLEAVFPERNFEIVNVSLTATNSYTVLEFVDELVKYKPDAFIIYSGQNEFYGALGVGSTISLGRERWLIRTYQGLRKFKTFILLDDALTALSDWVRGGNAGPLSGTLMEQMTKDQAIPFQGNLYRKARDAYEKNLLASVAIGSENEVPTIISTLVTNERSIPPFLSIHQDSLRDTEKIEVTSLAQAGDRLRKAKDYPGATGVYRKIASVDSTWAMAYFRLGECYDEMGKFHSARIAYEKARNLDGLRFRASSEYNEIIRRLAQMPNVIIADADSVFRVNSPDGIVGKELLWEHVHPNLRGYVLLSRTWFDALMKSKLFSSSGSERLQPPTPDSLFTATLRITPLDIEIGATTMSVLLHRWPFTGDSLSAKSTPVDEVERVAQVFVNGKLRWNEAHYEMADAYLRKNDLVSAVREFESVNALHPDDPFPLMRMGDLHSILLDDRRAASEYRRLLALGENPVARLKLGVTYLKLNQSEAALQQLSTAIEARDRSSVQLTREQSEDATFFYALACYKLGKNEKALEVLGTLLRLDPNNQKAARLSQEIQGGSKR
jgi:tetratricopeptide (TPR) repeat protein